MAIKFKGVDFIEFDTLLSDDERLVRDNTRKFIEENLVPIIEHVQPRRPLPQGTHRAHGRAGLLRSQPAKAMAAPACRGSSTA